ncbi:hypothetical protein EYR40_000417 [Pleurotus pulmonarius]|nr:hypothetical protein EYR36_001226 [Pleurotus pulmonarius]KAF4603255.1 hypothetical protein EYR38_003667 [Pleurotus pulmonarius]KAF4608074.1 hypothetical protein EYR40_000417 [Pleurotus pulmonarius]
MAPLCSRSLFRYLPFIALISLVALLPTVDAAHNSVYLIRNAEEPSLGFAGLTPVGQKRADECLPTVFGPSSAYNIGLIIACTPDVNTTDCHTSVATANPLATALKLTVNTKCSTIESNTTSPTCVPDLINTFSKSSDKSILIVWDVEHIGDLLDEFELENDEPDYPEEWPDIIFTLRNNYFIGQESQNCPDIDGPSTGVAAKASTTSFRSASLGAPALDEPATTTTEGDAPVEGEPIESEAPTSETVPEPVTTLAVPEPTSTESAAPEETPSITETAEPAAVPEPTEESLVEQPPVQKMRRRHMKKRLSSEDRSIH